MIFHRFHKLCSLILNLNEIQLMMEQLEFRFQKIVKNSLYHALTRESPEKRKKKKFKF